MAKFYEFEVSLIGVEPKIYRRFILPASRSFRELHEAIQAACGWEDDHMHEFLDDKRQSICMDAPIEGYSSGSSSKKDRSIKLYSYFADKKNKRCTYVYDFGDYWKHDVKLLRCFEEEKLFKRKLTGGERAFPPEDCGGIGGYEDCYEAVTAKKKTGYMLERLDWLWEWEWDPEAFDLKKASAEFNL